MADDTPTGHVFQSVDAVIWQAVFDVERDFVTYSYVSNPLHPVLPGNPRSDSGPADRLRALHDREISWVTALRTGRLRPGDRHIADYCFQGQEDQASWLREIATILHSAHPRTIAAGVLVDVTDLKTESKGIPAALLAEVSHDIRAPLSAIVGLSEVLSEDFTGEGQEFIRIIHRSSLHLMETINSVLDLAFFQDEVALRREQVDLAALARDVVDTFRLSAAEKGIALAPRIPNSLHVSADSRALWRILVNIVANAVKFTDAGQVVVNVEMRDSTAVLTVADTGAGMDPAFLPYLFDRYSQEAPSRAPAAFRGGLGLTIARRLVERLGGSIRAESTKGEGTTIRVELPAAPAESNSLPSE